MIACNTPPPPLLQGLGANLVVNVSVDNRFSAFPTPTGASFSYDAPVVTFVTPNPANAIGGGTLTL